MSPREIAHRIREQLRREADRRQFRRPAEADDLEFIHKAYFRSGPVRRFYSSLDDREACIDFLLGRCPHWMTRTLDEANALVEHRIDLLAFQDLYLGPAINWHRDPVSGFQWPRHYWADYDLVDDPPADAKVIHELNRHQHLPRLAKAFFLTGDETYAREAVGQLQSWIEQNPKWEGVNWHSSLEIAIRCISWLWTLFLLLASQSLSDEALRQICRSLFAQLDHVYRYPSTYSSPNTHLIGEATALFIAGTVFLELPQAANWREFGLRTLIDEMERQVPNDGVHGELSSYYHCYAADFYVHAVTLARRNRIVLPDALWQRLSGMFDFVMHITRPDGTIPLLGDDDGGRASALASKNYISYRDGLCCASILFGRPDFKYQSREFCEESLWLLGTEAALLFDGLDAQHPVELQHAFGESGYFVQRSGWRESDSLLTFDCGGLGFGSGGHSHADALSLTLFSGGQDFIVDPGTGVYNHHPESRRFFRSTGAHNIVLPSGKEQAQPGETFRWNTRLSSRLRNHISLFGMDYIDGSVEFQGGVDHRRRLLHVQPDYWVVLDELRGEGAREFDFLYHFNPDARLAVLSDESSGDIECNAQIHRARLQLFMHASETVRAETVQGSASRVYGKWQSCPVLKASVSGTLPVSMVAFLVPGNTAAQVRRVKANSHHAIAASIRHGDYEDVVVTTVERGELRLADFSMSGEFFWLRFEQGVLRRLAAFNANAFSYAGETVFESADRIPWVHACFWDTGILIERGDSEGKMYVRNLRDRQFQRH
jgi:hypothetical protein